MRNRPLYRASWIWSTTRHTRIRSRSTAYSNHHTILRIPTEIPARSKLRGRHRIKTLAGPLIPDEVPRLLHGPHPLHDHTSNEAPLHHACHASFHIPVMSFRMKGVSACVRNYSPWTLLYGDCSVIVDSRRDEHVTRSDAATRSRRDTSSLNSRTGCGSSQLTRYWRVSYSRADVSSSQRDTVGVSSHASHLAWRGPSYSVSIFSDATPRYGP